MKHYIKYLLTLVCILFCTCIEDIYSRALLVVPLSIYLTYLHFTILSKD